MRVPRACVVVLAAACTSASPSASAAPGAGSAPAAHVGGNAPSAPAPTAQRADPEVALLSEKTSLGGEVFSIGRPRFQLADPDGSGTVALRSGRKFAFAEDAKAIAIWDAGTGELLRRIAPRLEGYPHIFTSLAVSSDGMQLATGSSHVVRIFQAPFEKPSAELACSTAHAFSQDGKLLACATTVLGVWDLAKRQLISSVPKTPPRGLVRAVRFSADGRSLIWATEQGVFRWEFATAGAVATVYQTPSRITYAVIADGGGAAYVMTAANQAVVVDLASGQTTAATANIGTAISPSGKRLARAAAGMQVTDAATGKTLWSSKVASPITRLTFGETDDAVAYVEAGRIRVAMMPSAPLELPPTPRFAGWVAPGVAAIERGNTLSSFTLATRTTGAAERTNLARAKPEHAPAWAQWISEGPAESIVAAEPSKRYELPPNRRDLEPCNPKQRVWTSSGGAKTLTMTCTKAAAEGHEDPGWDIGGGKAIAVSAAKAIIYDAQTARRIVAIDVPARKGSKPEFAPAFRQMALAPSGDWAALLWRRAVLQGSTGTEPQDPREDAMHIAETAASLDCVSGDQGCELEYFAELWQLKGTPARVWQARLERTIPGRQLAEPAQPSGVLAFDDTGAQLFVGFAGGEIRVVLTANPATWRAEHMHQASVQQMTFDASDTWAFSSDSSGVQRLWKIR